MIRDIRNRGALFLCLSVLVVARSPLVETEFEDRATTLEATSNRRESRGKIKVELYYMPQCPGCRQLITTSFSEAFETPGFSDMADVTFVPYGTHLEDNHSSDEKQEQRVFDNILESCALHAIGGNHQEKQFAFIDCIDHSSNHYQKDPSRVDRACAVTIGLSAVQTRDIEACAISQEGRALAERNVRQTESIGTRYFPWIVVDRQHSSSIEAAVWRSLFDYVCGIYSGPHRSEECPESNDDDIYESDDEEDLIAEQL